MFSARAMRPPRLLLLVRLDRGSREKPPRSAPGPVGWKTVCLSAPPAPATKLFVSPPPFCDTRRHVPAACCPASVLRGNLPVELGPVGNGLARTREAPAVPSTAAGLVHPRLNDHTPGP